MLVGIHKEPYGKFSEYLEKFEKILDFNDIKHVRLDSSQEDFWDIIPTLDLFIYHFGHTDSYKENAETIMPIIENQYGIKCLPSQATCWHYDDKIRQYLLLKAQGFPVAQSWIFWNEKEAVNWIQKAQFPVIFKLKGGSGDSSVVMVQNKSKAEYITHRMFSKGVLTGRIPLPGTVRYKHFNLYKEIRHLGGRILRKMKGEVTTQFWRIHKNYVYFQKFYPKNQWDTRVTTVGDKVYAFRRFVRKNDFRSSGSDNWSSDREQIDKRFLQIALEISRRNNFQVMAYDFIYDENKEPCLLEISYCYGDYPEWSTGYWDKDLNWHDGNYCTQYMELAHVLNMPDLKNPELKPTGYYATVKAN
jgi:glutathione synthase/RimK-type ligase-like ATP-grasp enzyme